MKKHNKKQNIVVIISMVILLLIVVYILYQGLSNKNSKENINNNKESQASVDNNKESEENVEIELKSEKYLWKMKVNNPDGTNIYTSGSSDCIRKEDSEEATCEEREILTKIEYGTEVYIYGDSIDTSKYQAENSLVYDEYNFEKTKDYYSVFILYKDKSKEHWSIGYIDYKDVKLLDDTNYFMNKYEEPKKYYVTNNEAYLYDGPGLLFERTDTINIPKGEILEVEYYNDIYNITWLYVTYQGHSGWVLKNLSSSENNPYLSSMNGSLNELFEIKGTINVHQNKFDIYKYPFSDKKIGTTLTNQELSYDYITADSDFAYIRIKYNNEYGWLKGEYNNNCNKSGDIIVDTKFNIKICE